MGWEAVDLLRNVSPCVIIASSYAIINLTLLINTFAGKEVLVKGIPEIMPAQHLLVHSSSPVHLYMHAGGLHGRVGGGSTVVMVLNWVASSLLWLMA